MDANTMKNLKTLAKCVVNRKGYDTYSADTAEKAFSEEFAKLTGSVNNFLRNKYDVFDIIITAADDIVPKKVMEQFGSFAEVLQVANGDKPLFKRGGLGRQRAKKFLTQVGLSGVYESFRLDTETFTIGVKSIGGAVSIDFVRLIDGAESLTEFMDVLIEAQVDAIYSEIQAALMAAVNASEMPAKNKVSGTYSASALQGIINTVKAYGEGAVIVASPEFVDAMGPDAIVPAIASAAQAIYPIDDIESIHNTGRIRLFRGTPIVELRQSFLNNKNTQYLVNPQYAYILPSGREKIVKLVMEGSTQLWSYENTDQSVEVNTYRMIGTAILAYNNWGIYQNTDIATTEWYDGSIL